MAQQYLQQLIATLDNSLFQLRVYKDPQRIRNECIQLFQTYPSLQPRVGNLPRSPIQLIYLAGTVPIVYNNAQYNIPVAIWLVEQYPFAPPVCFVTPTPGMVIKPRHKHVDSQGICYLPYLSSWNPNGCNLLGLVKTMGTVFAQDPPVRSAPPNSAPPTTTGPPPLVSQGSNTFASMPPQPIITNSSPPPRQKPFEDQSEVVKRNLISKVSEKTQSRMRAFSTESAAEMDALFVKVGEKESKLTALDLELDRLRIEKDTHEQDIVDLEERFTQINNWLDQNDTSGEVDIDAVTEPRDPLSKQLLYLVAEDATIEDTLYYLEKALGKGDIDVDVFLKTVRNLASDQFMTRATIKKVHERQRGKS